MDKEIPILGYEDLEGTNNRAFVRAFTERKIARGELWTLSLS
jgi:hypothetical protein